MYMCGRGCVVLKEVSHTHAYVLCAYFEEDVADGDGDDEELASGLGLAGSSVGVCELRPNPCQLSLNPLDQRCSLSVSVSEFLGWADDVEKDRNGLPVEVPSVCWCCCRDDTEEPCKGSWMGLG